ETSTPAAKPLFSDTQVEALKALANRVLKKPDLVSNPPESKQKSEPTVRRVTVVPSPEVKAATPAAAKAVVKKAAVRPGKPKASAQPPKGAQQRKLVPLVDPSTGQPKVDP